MDLMTALFASQLNGKDAGLPSVNNTDNGKVLQVKSGKWAKGEEKFKSVGNEDFKLNYSTYKETDTLYLVNGRISEHFERVSENLTENTPSVVIAGPVTVPPRMVVINHEAWRAFHDDDEYGGWSTNYSEESSGGASYLEYKFETPAMIEYIDCKFKYENLSDGDAQAIPIKIFVETSEDGITWIRHERPLVDHDFSPSYRPSIATNRYAGVYKAIRFVSINPMYVSGVACVSIGNITFRGLVTNDDFNARSIWYQGFCFGELNEENDNLLVIEGTKNEAGTRVTLAEDFDTLWDFVDNLDKTIVVAVAGLPYAGYNYYILSRKNNPPSAAQQPKSLSFVYAGNNTYLSEGELGATSIRLTIYSDQDNEYEAQVINQSFETTLSGGPTRDILYEATPGSEATLNTLSNGTLLLSGAINEYDELAIYAGMTDGDSQFYSMPCQIFDVERAIVPNPNNPSIGQPMNVETRRAGHEEKVRLVITVNDNNHPENNYKLLTNISYETTFYDYIQISKVIGIKY